MIVSNIEPLIHRKGIRQFVKFCIVGATSFTIDFGISFCLTFPFHMWWVLAKTISFSLAVTNGFFLNQRWTFKAVGHRSHHEQYAMFFGTNIVGLIINLTIMKSVFFFTTHQWHGQHPKQSVFIAATLCATAIVMFWNFFASKHWTFKKPVA